MTDSVHQPGALPIWTCVMEVRAAKIIDIESPNQRHSRKWQLTMQHDGASFSILVSTAFMVREHPTVGGYYVNPADRQAYYLTESKFEESFVRPPAPRQISREEQEDVMFFAGDKFLQPPGSAITKTVAALKFNKIGIFTESPPCALFGESSAPKETASAFSKSTIDLLAMGRRSDYDAD